MRLPTCLLAAGLAAGCAQDDALVTYTIRDADPAVPIYAIQIFEIDEDGSWFNPPSTTWGPPGEPMAMPYTGGIGFDPAPPRFRVCAIARGETDDVLLSGVSPTIEAIAGDEVSVDFMLELAEDGEVPEPCGPADDPFPDRPAAL